MYKAPWLDVILYVGSVQGLFLIPIIWRKHYSNKSAVKYLTYLLLLSSLLMLGRVNFKSSFVNTFAEVILLPDVALFIFGPFLYFFTLSIFKTNEEVGLDKWKHYIPGLIHIFIFNTIIGSNVAGYFHFLSQEQLWWSFKIIELLGLISCFIYAFMSYKHLIAYYSNYSKGYAADLPVGFVKWVLRLVFCLLFIWFLAYTINLFKNPQYIIYTFIWIVNAILIFYISYKIILEDRILSLPTITTFEENMSYSQAVVDVDNVAELLDFMEENRPYLEPELSLQELADRIGWTKHKLSATINNSQLKNYFDFINEYRVKEFINIKSTSRGSLRTIMEVAYEVGFNSKSAFNRAFKKETNQSPTEYFTKVVEETTFSS